MNDIRPSPATSIDVDKTNSDNTPAAFSSTTTNLDETSQPEEIQFLKKHFNLLQKEILLQQLDVNYCEWKRTFWAVIMGKNIKNVVAPMVDQSELAFRMLLRKHGAHLCYTPMIHAHLFVNDPTYRKTAFTTVPNDRPLIVQFCANNPQTLLNACRLVEGFCDGVDLNLGCPQLIAKKGHYGAFLQEYPDLIEEMISLVFRHCRLPISAKIRMLDDVPSTVAYAQRIQRAGASMLTIHGRNREQKGVKTGLADWRVIRAVKEALQIPVLANGNIQMPGDVERCMADTRADGVMSAEGILSNPLLFDEINPLSFEAAEEYLNFAERYKAQPNAVRAHIFRICHHSFLKYDDLREKNAILSTVKEYREIIAELRKRCLAEMQITNSNGNGGIQWSNGKILNWQRDTQPLHELVHSTPHYICKPYIRPPPTPSEGDSLHHASSAYRQQRREEIERLATEAGVSKRRIRKREKRKRSEMKEINRKQLYAKCLRCQQPSGVNCHNAMCRRCCRWTSKRRALGEEESTEDGTERAKNGEELCKSHGFTVKLLFQSQSSRSGRIQMLADDEKWKQKKDLLMGE